MGNSYQFTLDVFRTLCEHLQSKANELQLLVETASSFEEWLIWEAFLACKLRQSSYPFCEVAAIPTYASEGVAEESDPDWNLGDLRVGGPNDGADHCWVFAEFVLIHDGNRASSEWQEQVETAAHKLKRLGWKKSASLVIVVNASCGDVRVDELANGPALCDPFVIALPDVGSVVVTAFDIKRDPTHVLTATAST